MKSSVAAKFGGHGVKLADDTSARAVGNDFEERARAFLVAHAPRVLQVARHSDRIHDPLVRQALAEIYSTLAVARWTSRRQTDQARGRALGSETSLGKLALVANQRRIAALIGELLGPRLVADTGEWGTYAWTEYILGAPGVRIAGGTDEIMRNVIGERVLGLPRD